MPASPNRPYVPQIDQLRGAACLLVIAYHGFQLFGAQLADGRPFDPGRNWVYSHNPLVTLVEEGHSGVGLFIVLSGFVLSLGTVGRRIAYGRFMLARALRIYPVLIVCVAAAVAAHPATLATLVGTLLLLNPADAVSSNLTAMVWAVSVEFLCYLAFPYLLRMSSEKGSRFLLLVVATALAMRTLAVFGSSANPRDISYWTVLGRIDQFCLGMVAARIYVLHGARDRLPAWSVLPAGAAVMAMLWLLNQAGGWPMVSWWKLMWPTVEAAVWAGFVLCYLKSAWYLPHFLGLPLTKLGIVSYPLYLVHFAVLAGCIDHGWLLRLTGHPYADALLTTALVALPIALVVALLLHVTVERGFMQLRRRYLVEGST